MFFRKTLQEELKQAQVLCNNLQSQISTSQSRQNKRKNECLYSTSEFSNVKQKKI
jgi:hypothetical protein